MADPFPADRELVLHRILDAPRDKVFRCWTSADLLSQWFTPKPWTIPVADMDFRPGGHHHADMRGPDGETSLIRHVWLEIVENERIVFTDAFSCAWEPAEHPFIVAIITFADAGPGRTDYRAVVRHFSVADTKRHEDMGFFVGWGAVTDQLEALAKTLQGRS